MCAFYFFWLSASHGLRLGMDGIMFLALCDHGFERSVLCAVNNNNNNNNIVTFNRRESTQEKQNQRQYSTPSSIVL